ncbi:hypothetical protein RND71_028609 [Anisodus tanguticus]|uniref:Uncharacterized protein n=1 Tax=Anisodus tanguticus TaxID=243964 RepID=A0AAE1RLA2_9SOLA|nr:hypothetical protein RND71_028609 [Anisodus tanguticus]
MNVTKENEQEVDQVGVRNRTPGIKITHENAHEWHCQWNSCAICARLASMAWSKNLDPSGRAALGVHADAYKEASEGKENASAKEASQKLAIEKAAVAV